MKPEWVTRAQPLAATAVVGVGPVAKALGRVVLGRDSTGLRAVVADQLLLVAGDPLPWVDGVIYLAADPQAPRVLVPTAREFSLHPQLVERALRKLPGLAEGAFAVLPDGTVVSLSALGAIDQARLAAWVGAAS